LTVLPMRSSFPTHKHETETNKNQRRRADLLKS
jgi:hypothetical protein